MGIVLKELSNLRELAVKLDFFGVMPDKVPVLGFLHNALRGNVFCEAIVDDWPEFTSVIIKPRQVPESYLDRDTRYVYTTDAVRLREIVQKDDPDWTGFRSLSAVPPRAVDVLFNEAKRRGFSATLNDCHIITHNVPEGPELAPELPPGYYLDSCRESDAETINSYWPYSRGEPSVRMIRHMVSRMPSICVREEGSGQPVCWHLVELNGEIGMAHTLVEHRRKGLFLMATTVLIKRYSQMCKMPYGFIVVGNTASEEGIKQVSTGTMHPEKVTWITLQPAKDKSHQ